MFNLARKFLSYRLLSSRGLYYSNAKVLTCSKTKKEVISVYVAEIPVSFVMAKVGLSA